MKTPHPDWIVPNWQVAPAVRGFVTTRAGGVSPGPYASMNLGIRSGDAAEHVARNRAVLREHLPADPVWLRQVHGARVVEARPECTEAEADAAVTRDAGAVCAVLVADCMPVLLADRDGRAVGLAHAGWRGLAGGVIESTVRAMGSDPACMVAWLGPAIGPRQFEVGPDVLEAFLTHSAAAGAAFLPRPTGPGKWLGNLEMLARQRLAECGVQSVGGGGMCTVEDARFFSHRRDRGVSGRMAALLWIDA
ncbi:MAG: peptidoglycan editing factor PgeF [Burkholderiales bacterium]